MVNKTQFTKANRQRKELLAQREGLTVEFLKSYFKKKNEWISINSTEEGNQIAKEIKEKEYITKLVTVTEMAKTFGFSSHEKLTVTFHKKIDSDNIYYDIYNLYQNSTPIQFKDNLKETIKKSLNGDERILTGFHNGEMNELGRYLLNIDESEFRWVDPRTITELIIGNIKYQVK